MYGDPALWHALLGRLADITISFLQIQVAAGVSAVQLFDSWSARSARTITGARSFRIPADLRGARAVRRAAHSLRGRNRRAARADGEAVRTWSGSTGASSRRSRPAGRSGKALQGNLDPAILLAPWEVIEERAKDVIARGAPPRGTCSTWAWRPAGNRPGHAGQAG